MGGGGWISSRSGWLLELLTELIIEPLSVFRSWQSREPGNRERGETKSRTCHNYWNANLATITCGYKPKIFLTSQTLSLLFQTSPLISSNMSAYCEESSSYSYPQLKSVATQAKSWNTDCKTKEIGKVWALHWSSHLNLPLPLKTMYEPWTMIWTAPWSVLMWLAAPTSSSLCKGHSWL